MPAQSLRLAAKQMISANGRISRSRRFCSVANAPVSPGFTHIADSERREAARIDDGEGVAVATVCLDPDQKRLSIPPERFRPWIADVPSEYRFFKLFEALVRRRYAKRIMRYPR